MNKSEFHTRKYGSTNMGGMMPHYVMGKAIAGMRNSYRRESGLNHTFIVDLNAPLIEKPKREEVSILFPPDVSFKYSTQSMKCEPNSTTGSFLSIILHNLSLFVNLPYCLSLAGIK